MFTDLRSDFANPKFLHVLFEWGLFWGLTLTWVFLLVCQFVLKQRRGVIFSLVLMALAALLVLPVEHYRKRVRPIGGASAKEMNAQDKRRADTAWVFYLTAGLAVAATLLGGAEKGAASKIVGVLVILVGLAAAIIACWLQLRETMIIYDFR